MSGDTVLVGAVQEDGGPGYATAVALAGSARGTKIMLKGMVASGWFGSAVAIASGTVFISAPAPTSSTAEGAVYGYSLEREPDTGGSVKRI